ncbi:nucleotidyltransferase domain-containing protein [Micromonospora sp. NPDC050686]|uniref:nucleotidyltransferase domain-containing protein n=1 Tax=Micromonospora sp. NPDC050686 TaxID=3154631 RepID=UPI0033EBF683
MKALDELRGRAEADSAVVGLVLTGSHARGMATRWSDVDVIVVVRERGGRWTRTRRSRELDEIVCTVDELADTTDRWQRYAYRGARVLLDRLDGGVAELVHRQAVPTVAEAGMLAREALDGYLNLAYRSAKSRRAGDPVAAELDARESVSWLLDTVFAVHGRLRPYNRYLRWELATYPLPAPWGAADLPGRALRDPVGLAPEVVRLARRHGLGEVVDAWGDDLALLGCGGAHPADDSPPTGR